MISRQLANRLGLQPGGAPGCTASSGPDRSNTAIIPQPLSSATSRFGSIDAPMLEAANMGADGMLGVDSLKSQRVLFDFKAKTMSITPSSDPCRIAGRRDDRRARAEPRTGG